MSDLNQGASIEARISRVLLQNTSISRNRAAMLADVIVTLVDTDRRTPAATTGELPPLPKPSSGTGIYTYAEMQAYARAAIEAVRDQLAVKGQGYAVEVKPGEKCPCGQTREWCITNECKDAAPTSAQQAGAAAPLIGSVAEAIAMRDAEIADLRAQLAQQGQEPVAWTSFKDALPPNNTPIFWRDGDRTGGGWFYAEDAEQWANLYWMLPPPLYTAPASAQPDQNVNTTEKEPE